MCGRKGLVLVVAGATELINSVGTRISGDVLSQPRPLGNLASLVITSPQPSQKRLWLLQASNPQGCPDSLRAPAAAPDPAPKRDAFYFPSLRGPALASATQQASLLSSGSNTPPTNENELQPGGGPPPKFVLPRMFSFSSRGLFGVLFPI